MRMTMLTIAAAMATAAGGALLLPRSGEARADAAFHRNVIAAGARVTSPDVPSPIETPVAMRTPSGTPAPQALDPIVALGDSITYGYGNGVTTDVYGPAPLHSYPWDMERDLGIPVINAGISGTTARQVLDPASQPTITRPVALQLPALLALRPRLVVVGFGTNEANLGWPIADTVAAFDQLLGRIAAAGVPIVLVGTHVDCSIQPCSASGRTYTAAWDAALTAVAKRYQAGLVLDVENGFTGADLSDWIHPTARGYLLVARRVESAVLARLR